MTRNMKKVTIGAITGAGLVLGMTGGASAVSDTFDATANIQTSIALTNTANLAFANIVPDAAQAGTVVIDTSGGRTCAPVLSCSGSTSAAAFDVSGSDGSTYQVTLPPETLVSSGGNNMTVSAFNSSLAGNTGTLTGGTDSFTIGGTLNVGANQATGSYTGQFTVTVEYN